MVTQNTIATWAACLPLVASSLRALGVNPLLVRLTQPFLDALHSLTALEIYTFDIWLNQAYLPAFLPSLNFSIKLKKLSLRSFSISDHGVILQALATPAATSLEALQMNISVEQIATEVKRACRTRNIRIELADGRESSLSSERRRAERQLISQHHAGAVVL
jgi:hypothetical protein